MIHGSCRHLIVLLVDLTITPTVLSRLAFSEHYQCSAIRSQNKSFPLAQPTRRRDDDEEVIACRLSSSDDVNSDVNSSHSYSSVSRCRHFSSIYYWRSSLDQSDWGDSILDCPIPGESLVASAIGGWPFGIVACQRDISLSFLFIRRLISSYHSSPLFL